MPAEELLYFDCHACFGPFPKKHREARWSRPHLLEDLKLAGIAGALAHHALSLHSDPMLGNLELVREIADVRGTLFPCWAALPDVGGAFPCAAEFVTLMRRHDVRAVRIDPVHYGFPVTPRVMGDLADALAETRTLCLLPVSYITWDAEIVDRLLSILHRVPTLLVGHGWGRWRDVAALMDAHPRLHLEFSYFQANRAMEYFAGKYGAERCLFGTALPHCAPGAARGFLDFTLLPREQASLIAGQNLRRLMGGQGPTRVPAPGPWSDSITEALRRGRPLPCLALDAHCHMGHDDGLSLGPDVISLQSDVDGMVELTRRSGIQRTAIMSWAGPLSMDSDIGNRVVEEAVRRYPDDFIGLATANPEFDDEEKIERIIQHYHCELGFPGLKTYTPCQTIDYDDPLFERWFQFANNHRLYLVFDPKGGSTATECAHHLCQRYPDLGIHLDHCGRSWEFAKWAVGLMKEYSNIWGQLNHTTATNGVVEYLVSQVGAERLLFGTDAPMRDPRPQVSWLAFTRLTEADKRKIYGENFSRVLNGVIRPMSK